LHARLGTNWRLSEVQSAVGRVQLSKLPTWLAHRRARSQRYIDALSRVPGLRVPVPPAHVRAACYKQYAYVEPQALRPGWSRDRVLASLAARGLYAASGSCSEIYLEKAFEEAMRPKTRLEVARRLGETSLMFKVDPTVTEADVDATCAALRDAMAEAVR
jgi:dTDP-4-amino-4,6-dideoxygalactose transaminase